MVSAHTHFCLPEIDLPRVSALISTARQHWQIPPADAHHHGYYSILRHIGLRISRLRATSSTGVQASYNCFEVVRDDNDCGDGDYLRRKHLAGWECTCDCPERFAHVTCRRTLTLMKPLVTMVRRQSTRVYPSGFSPEEVKSTSEALLPVSFRRVVVCHVRRPCTLFQLNHVLVRTRDRRIPLKPRNRGIQSRRGRPCCPQD